MVDAARLVCTNETILVERGAAKGCGVRCGPQPTSWLSIWVREPSECHSFTEAGLRRDSSAGNRSVPKFNAGRQALPHIQRPYTGERYRSKGDAIPEDGNAPPLR